jgi:hypothetical protein
MSRDDAKLLLSEAAKILQNHVEQMPDDEERWQLRHDLIKARALILSALLAMNDPSEKHER